MTDQEQADTTTLLDCPHCGARYSVFKTRVSLVNADERREAHCERCRGIMMQWSAPLDFTFKLVDHPNAS